MIKTDIISKYTDQELIDMVSCVLDEAGIPYTEGVGKVPEGGLLWDALPSNQELNQECFSYRFKNNEEKTPEYQTIKISKYAQSISNAVISGLECNDSYNMKICSVVA